MVPYQGGIPCVSKSRKIGLSVKALKIDAEKLPYGKEREALERKARELEVASQINQWVSSPGLQPPK